MTSRPKKSAKQDSKENNETLSPEEYRDLLRDLDAHRFTKSWLKRINTVLGSQPLTALVGMLATGSIIACVSYALGYIFTVDFRLISLFSLQDVISIGLPTVPLVATALVIFSILVVSFSNYEIPSMTESDAEAEHQKLLAKYKEAKKTKPFGWASLQLIVGGLLLFFLFLFFTSLVSAVVFGIVFGLLVLSDYLMRTNRAYRAGVVLFVAAIVCVLYPFAVFGAMRAEIDLRSSNRNYRVVFEGKPIDGLLMVANSEVIVLRDDYRFVRIIPRRLVSEIIVFDVPVSRPPLSFTPIWNRLFGSSDPEFNTPGR